MLCTQYFSSIFLYVFFFFFIFYYNFTVCVFLFAVLYSTGAACASQMYRLQMKNIAGKWKNETNEKLSSTSNTANAYFLLACKQKQ